jgi:hypothetical protein
VGPCRPEHHPHQEEREEEVDAQPAPGGGWDIEASQQKARRNATPDLLLKHSDATLATYV